MKNLYLLSILFIATTSQIILAQNPKLEISEPKENETFAFENIKSHPVIFGKKKDELPKIIKTRGIIEEVTISNFGCGLVHWFGTAKVKLLNEVKGYKHQYIYIVSTCFFITNKEVINKTFELNLSKLENWKKKNMEQL